MNGNIPYDQLRIVWILSQISGVGIQTFKRLQDFLRDFRELLSPGILQEISTKLDLGPNFVSDFETVSQETCFEQEFDRCSQNGIHLLSLLDPRYPQNLAAIYDPPLILYVKGALVPEDRVAIGIVGTRHPSLYGLKQANRLARELAEKGVRAVSGFARGSDGEDHR